VIAGIAIYRLVCSIESIKPNDEMPLWWVGKGFMTVDQAGTEKTMNELLEIMRRLRDPDSGCPWDLQQDFSSIVSHTVEETYELVDAIDAGDFKQVREELGDVLFQVVFYAQLAEERDLFTFGDVLSDISSKLVSRHPHVFGDLRPEVVGDSLSEAEVKENWERLKQAERETKMRTAILDDVPLALPALSRAQKLQKRAARVGFDWPAIDGVWEKIEEEVAEVREAIAVGSHSDIEAEVGDVLIAVVNLARHLGVDAETAARRANGRFESRFRHMEKAADEDGVSLRDESLAQLEQRWQRAKAKLASA
jgi:ATP diphosphatase